MNFQPPGFLQSNPTFNRALQNAGQVNVQRIKQAAKGGRNGPCPCGSGKKYKKCCLARINRTSIIVSNPGREPKPKELPDAVVHTAATSLAAPADKNATAVAMYNAGLDKRIIWAFLETGIYITKINRPLHPPDVLAKWDAALEQYDAATPEEQKIMLTPARSDD